MTVFISQQLPSEHEIGEKNPISTSDIFTRFSMLESGLEFIFSHLSGPQFPRKIMTAISNGQKEVDYKDTAILHYQGALWQDCRVSAFYPGQKNPDLIFIDLDVKDFNNERALKIALTKILNRIKQKIGGHPTILWSGRGYHVIQPINCTMDLDTIKEFADLLPSHDKDVNKAFLQFAARYLSDNKKDSCNKMSLKSCLLRIPHSHNVRCKAEGKDSEVRILQRWDGFRPDVKLMLGSFFSYLVAKKLEEDQQREKYSNSKQSYNNTQNGQGVTYWIEKLIDTPLDDFRQIARDLIIIPYLIVRRGITDIDEIEAIVMCWANKCNELEPLNPSYRDFKGDMRYRIGVVKRDMIPPMRLDTLKEENPALAERLMVEVGK